MHRRGKASEMPNEADSEEHLRGLCPEIAESGVLTPQELLFTRRLQHLLDSQSVENVKESAAGKLDVFMRVSCAKCDVNWRGIPNRSYLQTALYYVFFRKVEPTYPPTVNGTQALLELFPEFEDQPDDKLRERVEFANAVALLSHYIPPRQNKQVYIEVASRLASNFQRRFVTGGGQTRETNDRVLIYERLCGVVKSRRNRRTKEQIRMDERTGGDTIATRRKARQKAKQLKAESSDGQEDSSSSSEGPKYSQQELEELAARVLQSKCESKKRPLAPDYGTGEGRPILPAQRVKQEDGSAAVGYRMQFPTSRPFAQPGILRPNMGSASSTAFGRVNSPQKLKGSSHAESNATTKTKTNSSAATTKRPTPVSSERPSVDNWVLPLLEAARIQGDINDDDFDTEHNVQTKTPPPPQPEPSPPPAPAPAPAPAPPVAAASSLATRPRPEEANAPVPVPHPLHHHYPPHPLYFHHLHMHHHQQALAQAAAQKFAFAKFSHPGQAYLEPPARLREDM